MKVTLVPGDQLTPDHVSAWSRLQRANHTLDSPFLRPEYTQLVASVREGVEVAVLKDGGETVGFFAFQREKRGLAYPVGYPMCDFQAIIVAENTLVDVEDLMHRCRLRAWHFDHLIASQDVFLPYHCVTASSPYIDLSGGFEKYLMDRAGSKTIKNCMKKARRAGREIGPIRFELHTMDRQVLETLIRWKTASYRRMKVTNYLSPAWRIAIIERIVTLESEAFSGNLSALYFGDRLASVELGLRSYGVRHGWFCSYCTSLHRYSPGSIHQIELAKNALALGIQRLDLGKGNEPYKTRFMTGATTVAEGSVDLRPVARVVRQRWLRTRDWARASSLKTPARFVVRNARALLNSTKERALRLASIRR